MLVLQYRCGECSSFFEYLHGASNKEKVDCIACGSLNVLRSNDVPFYPNKNFCPHDKTLDKEVLKDTLKVIMHDKSQKCGGCGVDGAAGSCKSSGGGCKGGGCGGCGKRK